MKALPLKECDAMTIAKKILDYLNENKLSFDKLILFTSNGAVVMLGSNNSYILNSNSIAHISMSFIALLIESPKQWVRLISR